MLLTDKTLPGPIRSLLGLKLGIASSRGYLDKKSTSATKCYSIRAEQVTVDENGIHRREVREA